MNAITLKGVKTHNLKNIDVTLPHGRLYVVTGVSGSGKSSLAFDTLYAEGQRRYVESLSAYARQFLERMEKPDVESVAGIPPALAIEAKNVIVNARSTVGTQTEINDYLRLLFARGGKVFCPHCDVPAQKSDPAQAADYLLKHFLAQNAVLYFSIPWQLRPAAELKAFLPELEKQGFSDLLLAGKPVAIAKIQKKQLPRDAVCVVADRLVIHHAEKKRLIDSLELAARFGRGIAFAQVQGKILKFSEQLGCLACGTSFRESAPNLFSFNSPLGACSACQGFGRAITLDWDLVVPDVAKTIVGGAIEPWTKPSTAWEFKQLLEFCKRKEIPVDRPWKKMAAADRRLLLEGREGAKYISVKAFFAHLEKKTYKMHVRIFLAKYRRYIPCIPCGESRLKSEALFVKLSGKNIYQLQCLSLSDLADFLETLQFSENDKARVEPVYVEIKRRVRFLVEVGLGYLSLARLSRTLSGGEVQRIHLASSLGSALVDTLYVLDEPSIGLHERDNHLLIRLMKELRDLGNTLVVVEHDRTMIEAADEVLDMGPGGGEKGGELLFQGTVSELRCSGQSLTAQYLSGRRSVRRIAGQFRSEMLKHKTIDIQGAREHNLKGVDVSIPLGCFVVLTGVSGSGKSTLVYDVLYKNYLRQRGRSVQEPGRVGPIRGLEQIEEMVLVDQSPIGRTPRSNPVTYMDAYDEIRRLFAATADARQRALSASSFSFNVDGGRCSVCKGAGQVKVEMHFLADVFMRCESCGGKRFREEVMEVLYEGRTIDDVLGMTIDEALIFFEDCKKLSEKLSLLERTGLGYLRLGQSATTLSGGEAQRLKLAQEMAQPRAGRVLYVFDEPTTGLHYHDIHFLLKAFDELLTRGHSLLVIEHNMEVISAAEWAIDLGPEGGDAGGQLVYAGPLKGLLSAPKSYTGEYLKKYLRQAERRLLAI